MEDSGFFKVVGETGAAEQALVLAKELRPAVVTLEVQLAGNTSGLDLARTLRRAHPDMRLLVLTGVGHEVYVRRMLEAGVDGYVLKTLGTAEVVDSLRMVMSGQSILSAGLRRSLVRDPAVGSRFTNRQMEILQYLAEGKLNDEIAGSLGVSVKAVQMHLTGIYAGLGARSRTEALVLAAKQGLVSVGALMPAAERSRLPPG